MSDLLVDYYIYFLHHTDFPKLRVLLFVAFTVRCGKEREEWWQRQILILKISLFGCCAVIKGQAFPALQTAHTSGLLHQAVLLTLVIYWDSHDSACLFLCGFGGGFETRVCEIKQEGGKLKSVMHHFGDPCDLQGGLGVGRASWALVALPALSPRADGATWPRWLGAWQRTRAAGWPWRLTCEIGGEEQGAQRKTPSPQVHIHILESWL